MADKRAKAAKLEQESKSDKIASDYFAKETGKGYKLGETAVRLQKSATRKKLQATMLRNQAKLEKVRKNQTTDANN
jgi:hypothetical protein